MKYALITGASSGIGHEMARVFAQHGHHLILTARSEQKLRELKNQLEAEYKIKAEVIPGDLSTADGAAKLFRAVLDKNLEVEILVNNAGFGDHALFQNSSLEKQKEMIQLNVMALTELTHLFLPGMLKRASGKILNVASTASFQPGPYMSVYYATKAYVLFFSEGLYEDLAGTGVSVTALCPGPTRSGFQAAANVKDISLLETAPMATSLEVALYGYKALMKGKAIAIPGWLNRVMAESVRFAPRSVIRKVVKRLQAKRLPAGV